MTTAWIPILIGLFGGLALFLYGMHQMSDGLKSAAGDGLKALLEQLTSNRFSAALTGAVLTAVIQSSSVTTVLLVGFVDAGLMSVRQSVGVIMGANAGTTVTGQIAAFKVTEASWLMILAGYVLATFVRRGTVRHYGSMLIGLGLLFLGMDQMSQATQPLRSYEPFIQLMRQMDHPAAGMCAGAVFTAVVQSSSATTGIVITLASGGFLSLEAGIALTIGANIGTCVTAMLSTIGKSPVAVRTAVVHVIFNVAGALIWLGLIGQLAEVARLLSPAAVQLQGVERLAAETPRQIANANTIFNIANTLILIWFVSPIASLAMFLVPDRPRPEVSEPRLQYLDRVYLQTPSLALDRIRLEIGHLGDHVIRIVAAIPRVMHGSQSDLDTIRQQGSEVDQLRLMILDYLRSLDVAELSDGEALRMEQSLSAIVHVAGAAELAAGPVVRLGSRRLTADVKFSDATVNAMQPLQHEARGQMTDAIAAFCQRDSQLAASVLDRRSRLEQLAQQVMSHLAERISSEDPHRALLFSLEAEMVSHLRWLSHTAGEIAELVDG